MISGPLRSLMLNINVFQRSTGKTCPQTSSKNLQLTCLPLVLKSCLKNRKPLMPRITRGCFIKALNFKKGFFIIKQVLILFLMEFSLTAFAFPILAECWCWSLNPACSAAFINNSLLFIFLLFMPWFSSSLLMSLIPEKMRLCHPLGGSLGYKTPGLAQML